MRQVKYEGFEKQFVVKRKIKRSFIKKTILIFLTIILFYLSVLAGLYTFKVENDYIGYNEKGTIDYKVYLKDNSYYGEEFFTKSDNMSFVSNLIKTINVDFIYEISALEEITNSYDYNISAELFIYDKDDQTKVLYSDKEILKEVNVDSFDKNKYIVKDSIDVDYDYYNEQVLNFKKDYSLSVISELILTMNVQSKLEVNGNSSSNNSDIKVSIPLTVQTLDINMATSEFNNPLKLGSTISNVNFFNIMIFSILCLLTIITITLFFLVSRNVKKDIYQQTIKKYLRQYDRVIIASKQPNLNEARFDQKIRIMSIEELIDAHDTLGKPILYYEVVPNEKSYFIIIADGVLYKLTISRAYLEKQEMEKKASL